MRKPTYPRVRFRLYPDGNKNYFIDYYDPFLDKRIRVVIGTRRRDAEKRGKQIYDELMAKFTGDDESEKTSDPITIEDAINIFLEKKEGRLATESLRRYRIYANNFVIYMKEIFPSITYINEVRTIYIESHLQDLRKRGQHPKSLNGALQFLKALFRDTAKANFFSNPIIDIRPFPERNRAKLPDYWTQEQVRLILDTVKPHWRAPLEFLYHTGLRKGELINLTWKDVVLDTDNPHIIIQDKEDWRTKTSQHRKIPLNKSSLAIIHRQRDDVSSPYVFKGKHGGQVHRDKIYRALKIALDKLNLNGNVHSFRHTYASHLVMKGIGIETVSKLLGHTTLEMTMKYAHLAPDHLAEAVKALE